MPASVSTVLTNFLDGVRRILGEHLLRVILYGSYARGDADVSSDIDLMILVNIQQYEYWQEDLPFYRSVRDEGVVLA